ncbi:MAG: hypothetical protein E6R04_00980 [Spirochaetes bacterium]|nr:MAG: hypothetical protein E6R04_00980 [Spirochaetota bacterium]
METKTYILDTNVLLSDPTALFSFQEHDLVIPMIVLEELDRHKDRQDEVGRNARETSRKLTEITKDHKAFKDAVPLGAGLGRLYIMSINSLGFKDVKELLPSELEGKSGDNQILALCLALKKKTEGKSMETVLISRDVLLRLKANALGVASDDYKKLHVAKSAAGLYSGSAELTGDFDLESFYADGKLELPEEIVKEFHENQYLNVTNPTTGSHALMRLKGNIGHKITEFAPCKINGKNLGQKCAIDALLDPSLPLVTVVGQAGTGKTLIAIAAGLHQVLERKQYKSLIVCRPIQPLGKDIGFLPGPQPLYSKVLTPSGWKTMGDMQKGDTVIGRDGKPATVLDVFPKGAKEILKLTFDDGAVVECCEDHPWNTLKPHEDMPRTRSTKDIETDLLTGKEHLRHFIQYVQPVQFSQAKELPLDPYVLGAILGDGCVSQRYAVELSSADSEIVERVQRSLPAGVSLRHKSRLSWSFVMTDNIGKKKRLANVVRKEIEAMGLNGANSYTKFIPANYLLSSIENRIALMQGLMDTDGYVSADGTDISLTTCSKELAQGFQELVQSLGGAANMTYSEAKTAYTISVSFWNKDIHPFHLSRKANRYEHRKLERRRRIMSVERTSKQTEMKCLLVDNQEHLYVTDGFVVTHNTMEEKMEPWIAPIKDNLRYLLSADGKKSKRGEETLQMLFDNGTIEVEAMTFIRGRSIANAYIIIDEAQNLNAHELKTIITRVGEGTKIVLTGDIEQIDNMYVDSVSNGLTIAIEKFKSYAVSGHVTLTKGERSTLATLAAQIL